MLRLFDLFAILALAVVLLMPKASVDARPALDGTPADLDRISHDQDDLYRDPGDVKAAVALANDFIPFYRTDWALATLEPFVERERQGAPVDARVHLAMAAAHAERLEPAPAVEDLKAVDQACAGGEGSERCPFGTLARISLIRGAMQSLVDRHIDPRKDPARAKLEVYRALHLSRPHFTLKH